METFSTTERIFSTVASASFVGRKAERERLLAHATGNGPSSGIALLTPPAAGATELLAQVYDHLFFNQPTIIPFYFRVKPEDGDAISAARRFLNEFVAQTVAFRAKEPGIIDAAPDIREISKFASEFDAGWIVPLIEGYKNDGSMDKRAFIRQCISAPLRVSDTPGHVFVMIDDLHNALLLEGGKAFLADLKATFERSPIPVVFSGLRRFLYDQTRFPHMTIGQLSFAEAGQVVAEHALKLSVSINDQTRDLIAVQLGGRPAHISTFITSAYDAGAELSTFSWTEQFYTDEVFGGRLSRRIDSILNSITPDTDAHARIIGLLQETMAANRSPVSRWKEDLGLNHAATRSAVDLLHHSEIINFDGSNIVIDASDLLLTDYIRSQSLLSSSGRPRALIVGEEMVKNVRRPPYLMARSYRKHSAIGLVDLMKAFDGRQISSAVLDYTRYKNELKGAPFDQALTAINEDTSRIQLPKCVFAALTTAYYPQLEEICEPDRSATAICMTDGDGEEDKQMAWIAAEIDSKLEATSDVAEFWCDRLEMVAVSCNFENYKIWLVAPEGFDPDAMSLIESRGAIGSSREQADLLRGLIGKPSDESSGPVSNVYEFVVPMGGDTEMIAAHTVEEIARRHNYPTKVINQIKTALVEACINASEHSLSPDRRIHQTFTVDDERITITVGNRGIRIKDKPELPTTNGGRRGWGLRLIKSLMDEVDLASTDDGTLITMVKYVGVQKARVAEPQLVD